MRYLVLSALIVVSACGRLSDDERKKLRDGMEQNKIVKVTDDEIVTTALDEGRLVFQLLEKARFSSRAIDSLSRVKGVRIHWTKPGDKNTEAVEQQLIDAYVSAMVTGDLQDNIQKLYLKEDPAQFDSLVYSKPVVTRQADGVENLEGMWNVYIARKNVVIKASSKN
ncbi:hypothetical protein [Pseudochryseolinea flava]|uniref:Uncharacterized protein n=1 Tax=Pseudochryseolinea flava TaxID=2059302 RepID=A0A364Y882_9BACT|nr:hypothetical protein [Pseudochryseolinea flava]RAW03113.1 hypothetical protein DQQ10_03175 [Pseudochryseolinea flava]